MTGNRSLETGTGRDSPGRKRSAPATSTDNTGSQCAIVGIGASAGGLEACKKLLDAWPADSGMALILVLHLDPAHKSMMADLLASHTAMTVREAADGMVLEDGHLYVIPPGSYLSIESGTLRLSQPRARHGARLPFDFLLQSMAQGAVPNAACIVLSGTGADGSLGIQAFKASGGFVIAQDPDEAGFGAMPQHAIDTGAVDLVLAVSAIPGALVDHALHKIRHPARQAPEASPDGPTQLSGIIELLRLKTSHDFTLYKPGTLERRVHRRMATLAINPANMNCYLEILQEDPDERDRLTKDLLINVTSFFRDKAVFEKLAQSIIPGLIKNNPPGQALRIWIAGCSTGEEAYSLLILLREEILTSKSNIKIQVFESDVDPEAIATARDGLYPAGIAADVSSARLDAFFTKEDHGYRIRPELRAAVVFTIHDILADPPFSRLDMISCRNLLIYFGPEAQKKAITLFHFALRQGGILILGSAETAGAVDDRFEIAAKAERIYRKHGTSRSVDLPVTLAAGENGRIVARAGIKQPLSRQAVLADLCRQLVMDAYAPASVLINKTYECLYYLGPVDKYLKVAPGLPIHDVFSMARDGVRTKLRSVIQEACREDKRTVASGGQIIHDDGTSHRFSISVEPVISEGKQLMLICFVDEPVRKMDFDHTPGQKDTPRIVSLERELEATRTELQGAIRNLEIASEDQKVINEEALSVSEEYQSANEELLTSKEELQSLNEELTALNGQLQETLERQRTASNDLQNVLYSTDVATLFLDRNLDIRFFTPATKVLFNVIPTDVGRPLSDLNFLSPDKALPDDARTVLKTLSPVEREVETENGTWFIRRILPYRAHDNSVKGVVITFNDITERKQTAKALEAARQEAELATAAKSRFLATASHDLRQPLQTLALLHGLLTRTVEGEKATKLVDRLDEALGSMTDMLNALLDINQIDAGTIRPHLIDFPVSELLSRFKDEYSYHAIAKNLTLQVVPCGASVHSDPTLLEQMIRNLLSNALKYTKTGKILIGCRHRGGQLSIEIWDTGIGIPEGEFQSIFEEYRQLDNPARERSLGLGLGLSIVQRLGTLLGHRVHVASRREKGSVFSIDVPLSQPLIPAPAGQLQAGSTEAVLDIPRRSGVILIIEDDPEISELLTILLQDEGHHLVSVGSGHAAMDIVAHDAIRPDLILTDYNLPGPSNGLEVAMALRVKLHHDIPVIILTGDIGTGTLRAIAQENCLHLNKPIKLNELTGSIQRLLSAGSTYPVNESNGSGPRDAPVIFVVDDDPHAREGIRAVLEEDGRCVEDYPDCESFLKTYHGGREACLLLKATLPGMSGLDLLEKLAETGHSLPTIMMARICDVAMAVVAMKAGAMDFIEKPIGRDDLLASVDRALDQAHDTSKVIAWRASAATQVASLTRRQHEIMDMVLAGHPSKNIAADLGISQRTVENHRASIMKRTGSKSLPALARLALAASTKEIIEGDDPALVPAVI